MRQPYRPKTSLLARQFRPTRLPGFEFRHSCGNYTHGGNGRLSNIAHVLHEVREGLQSAHASRAPATDEIRREQHPCLCKVFHVWPTDATKWSILGPRRLGKMSAAWRQDLAVSVRRSRGSGSVQRGSDMRHDNEPFGNHFVTLLWQEQSFILFELFDCLLTRP
jgi:hypothetical protein